MLTKLKNVIFKLLIRGLDVTISQVCIFENRLQDQALCKISGCISEISPEVFALLIGSFCVD